MASVLQVKAIPLPAVGYKLVTGTITFDNSYPTGGLAMDLSAELDTVIAVFFDHYASQAGAGVVAATFRYDAVNKKVMAYGGAAANAELAEFTATKDLSAYKKVGFLAIGLKS